MHFPSEIPDGPSWRNLARLAFILCFAGSSIYVIEPLRPFHLGIGLATIVLLLNGDWRRTLMEGKSLPLILGLSASLLVSWIWAADLKRFSMYAAILCIGLGYMALAETMTRRRVRFVEYFLPICAFWFIAATFSAFDVWTASTQFRQNLLITGGVWHNINDMGTALVYACLIWMLLKRRLPLTLFAACWFYALLLNRRADLVATGILGLGYLILYVHEKHTRIKLVATWAAASLVAFSLQQQTFHWGALPTLAKLSDEQCTSAFNENIPLSLVASGCLNSPSASAPNPVTRAPDAAPNIAPPPIAPSAGPDTSGQITLVPIPLDAGAMLMPPTAVNINPNIGNDVVAHGGDVSTAIRSKMVLDMWGQARAMPWWQWLIGMGVGQLNLQWPLTGSQWASPHFFWLEMFFYLGLPWFAFLAWLFLRSDGLARLALITGAVAGMAPSSMIYFQPFWFLLGVLLAGFPSRGIKVRDNSHIATVP